MKKILTFLTIFLFISVSLFSTGVIETKYLDDTPRIAVVSAFGPELTLLKENVFVDQEFVVNGRTFTTGTLDEDEVVLFYSGVSMVNAAMTMQLAIDNFNISHIVFSGIAGGVNPSLNIGDVTVPQYWAQYQEAVFARETSEGVFDAGWHEVIFPNFGMMFPQPVNVTSNRVTPDETEEMFWFEVDEKMFEVAKTLRGNLLATNGEANLTYQPKLVVGSNGVSGMTFVDNAEYRKYAFEVFEAQCLDMESAAIAHVAYANEIPFIVFRSLSDLAGGGDGENEIGIFFSLAAINAANVLLEWFEIW